MFMKRIYSGYIFFLFFSVLIIYGQTSISLYPLNTELGVRAGKNKKDAFSIKNDSLDSIQIQIKLKSWYLKKDGTPVFLESEDYPFSCKEWIILEASEINLSPGERKPIHYIVSVPKGTLPGDYWAAFSFEPILNKWHGKEVDSMIIRRKIMASVFVKVGNIKPTGKIIDIFANKEEGQTEIGILIQNNSKSHFYSCGKLEIMNEQGKKVVEQELYGELILPESERQVKVDLEKDLASGKYLVKCEIELQSRKTLKFQKSIIIE